MNLSSINFHEQSPGRLPRLSASHFLLPRRPLPLHQPQTLRRRLRRLPSHPHWSPRLTEQSRHHDRFPDCPQQPQAQNHRHPRFRHIRPLRPRHLARSPHHCCHRCCHCLLRKGPPHRSVLLFSHNPKLTSPQAAQSLSTPQHGKSTPLRKRSSSHPTLQCP